MTESQRRQIKGALERCAKENENKVTPTFNIRIADVCRAGAERIAELEKENEELKIKLENTIENWHKEIENSERHFQRMSRFQKENEELKAKLCLMRKWIYGNFDLEDKIAQLKFIDEFGKELSE